MFIVSHLAYRVWFLSVLVSTLHNSYYRTQVNKFTHVYALLKVLTQPFPSHSMTCLRQKYPGVLTRLPCWLALTAGNHPGQPSPHPYRRFSTQLFLFPSLHFSTLVVITYSPLPIHTKYFLLSFFFSPSRMFLIELPSLYTFPYWNSSIPYFDSFSLPTASMFLQCSLVSLFLRVFRLSCSLGIGILCHDSAYWVYLGLLRGGDFWYWGKGIE